MTGDIFFNNTEVLSYDHTFNFWGDARNYSNTQLYTIRSRVTGSAQESVSGVWTNSTPIINFTRSGLCHIYINDVNIGLGRVSNVVFDRGTDVQSKSYTATVEIPLGAGSGMFGTGAVPPSFNTGDFFTGSYISYFTSPTGRFIRDFVYNESAELVGKNKFTLAKECSFSIDDEITDAFGVTPDLFARTLMSGVKNSIGNDFLSVEYPSFYQDPSGISYKTQSFDILNNTYSFNERFDYQTGLPYFWSFSHVVNFDGAIVTVQENGSIKGTRIINSPLDYALTGWNTVLTGIYGRVSGAFATYTDKLALQQLCPLYNYPITASRTRDFNAATIEYSYGYSNTPFIQSGYIFEYSDNIDHGEDGYVTVSENGTYRALTNVSGTGFYIALAAYQNPVNQAAALSRINSLYSGATGTYRTCLLTGFSTLNQVASSQTYKQYDAEVSYNLSYTDNPNHAKDSLVYFQQTTYSDDRPTTMVSYFPVPYSQVVAQSAQQNNRGLFSNKINFVGATGASIAGLVARAQTLLKKPSGTDIYVSDYSYSYNPLTRNFSLQLDYVYSDYRDKGSYFATD